jgi:signal transduction histidine kinase
LVERLIANLLDNAIAHNYDGGWVGIETATESDRVVLRVANSGRVIYPDELERLFEPFHRAGAERTDTEGHYGLGLSIARAIVRAHEGEIAAAPQPGGGLTVTVSLPAAK